MQINLFIPTTYSISGNPEKKVFLWHKAIEIEYRCSETFIIFYSKMKKYKKKLQQKLLFYLFFFYFIQNVTELICYVNLLCEFMEIFT